MLARLIVIIILFFIHMYNHYFIHLKCHVNYLAVKKMKNAYCIIQLAKLINQISQSNKTLISIRKL